MCKFDRSFELAIDIFFEEREIEAKNLGLKAERVPRGKQVYISFWNTVQT